MSAIRLTFLVDDGTPSLRGKKNITVRVPPPRHVQMMDREVGTWFETRDGDGKRRYAKLLDSTVLSPMVEVRTGVGEPDLTLIRSRAKQLLHVVIPDDPAQKTFHLLRRAKKNGEMEELLSGEI